MHNSVIRISTVKETNYREGRRDGYNSRKQKLNVLKLDTLF